MPIRFAITKTTSTSTKFCQHNNEKKRREKLQ